MVVDRKELWLDSSSVVRLPKRVSAGHRCDKPPMYFHLIFSFRCEDLLACLLIMEDCLNRTD